MKLLIVPSFYPASLEDPTGIFIRDQARVLSLRHDVTVLNPRLLTPRALLRQSLRPASHTESPTDKSMRTLREVTIGIPNLTNRLQGLTHRLWRDRIQARSARLVEAGTIPRPDLVHAHVVRPAGAAAVVLAQRWGAKSVLTEHSGPFSVHLETAALRQRTHATLQAFDRVVAVSPFLAREIQSAFRDISPDVVGNVVDESYFCPGALEYPRVPEKPFRFLFVGGLTWHKGVDILLDASVHLRNAGINDWQLVIVGDGPDRRNLEQRIAKLSLEQHIVLAGSQPRDVVRAWIRSSDILVQPSRIETFCVVLIEAIACGVPVIATDSGGPSWIVSRESGRIIAVGDSQALADAMAAERKAQSRPDPTSIRSQVVSRFGTRAWLNAIEKIYAAI